MPWRRRRRIAGERRETLEIVVVEGEEKRWVREGSLRDATISRRVWVFWSQGNREVSDEETGRRGSCLVYILLKLKGKKIFLVFIWNKIKDFFEYIVKYLKKKNNKKKEECNM